MTSRSNQIDLSPLIQGLEQPLQLISDPEARDRQQAYIDAARPQVERAAFDILSGVVTSFNEASTEQRASLEYADGSLHLRIEDLQEPQAEPVFGESELERVTLRLPKELKELIDLAARQHGMSANSWYVRALSIVASRQLRGWPDGRGVRHGRGWGGFRGRGQRPENFAGDGDD
jgi:predicted HicB family RNase H-like nuclease